MRKLKWNRKETSSLIKQANILKGKNVKNGLTSLTYTTPLPAFLLQKSDDI